MTGPGLPSAVARLGLEMSQPAPRLASGSHGGVARTILDQVHVTTSGFFTLPPFLAALLTFGADRIPLFGGLSVQPERTGARFS